MLVTLDGIVIDVNPLQFIKVWSSMSVSPIKYCNSLNDVMLLFLKTVTRLVTAAASLVLSSPSPLVSQFCTHSALTFASAKDIISLLEKVIK